MPWAEENFPSADTILQMLKNSPKELGLPFVDVGGEINIAMGDLIGDIAAYPDGDIDTFTNMVWENLNEENKVSLFVRYIDIETGAYETRIVNKNH